MGQVDGHHIQCGFTAAVDIVAARCILLDTTHSARDVDYQTPFTVLDLVCQCRADPVGAQRVDVKHPRPLLIVDVTEGLPFTAINTCIVDQEINRMF